MVNGVNEAVLVALLAVITMCPVVPSLRVVGVPLRAPLRVSKCAHVGCPEIVKATTVLLADAVGLNEYVPPAITLIGGTPCSVTGGAGRAVVAGETLAAAGVVAESPPPHPAKSSVAAKHAANLIDVENGRVEIKAAPPYRGDEFKRGRKLRQPVGVC
jgi:hypothetical protein